MSLNNIFLFQPNFSEKLCKPLEKTKSMSEIKGHFLRLTLTLSSPQGNFYFY